MLEPKAVEASTMVANGEGHGAMDSRRTNQMGRMGKQSPNLQAMTTVITYDAPFTRNQVVLWRFARG